MKIESASIVEGKILLKGGGREFYLMDGVYSRNDGETVTVSGNQIAAVLSAPDLDTASIDQLENYVADLEQQLSTVGNDAQLANIELQSSLQKQQQTLQTMSNIAKLLHDTAMAVIRKIG